MNNYQSTISQLPHSDTPTLVFDLKKNRIRIHKKTLHMLGNPDYVQFLVNPDARMIGIKASTAKDKTAERIKWQTIGDHQCCEFYSKYLIMRLKFYCYNWDKQSLYRISGEMIPNENLAMFCLNDSVLIDKEADE